MKIERRKLGKRGYFNVVLDDRGKILESRKWFNTKNKSFNLNEAKAKFKRDKTLKIDTKCRRMVRVREYVRKGRHNKTGTKKAQIVAEVKIKNKIISARSDNETTPLDTKTLKEQADFRLLQIIDEQVGTGGYDADEGAQILASSKAKVKYFTIYYKDI